MGKILLTEEQWNLTFADCPCYIPHDQSCSCKLSQFLLRTCAFDLCPLVFWLNAINIEK